MLSKEDITQIEQGNEEPAYREYCEVASNFTWFLFSYYLPLILFYLLFFKFLKFILFSKIIIGIAILPLLFLSLLFFVCIFQILFALPKNKWLKFSAFIHLTQYGLAAFFSSFYIFKILF